MMNETERSIKEISRQLKDINKTLERLNNMISAIIVTQGIAPVTKNEAENAGA